MKKKTIKNDRQSAILDFISAKFVLGFPCVSPYILFFLHGPAILLFLSYISKWPLNNHFKIVCPQKIFRSLVDIAMLAK